MKAIKVLIILFAALGLSIAVVPYDGVVALKYMLEDMPGFLQFLAWFGVPLIMGLLMLKSPAPIWMPVVALAGFSFGFVRLHLWEKFKHLGDNWHTNTSLILFIAIVGGMLFSVIAVVKPDATA